MDKFNYKFDKEEQEILDAYENDLLEDLENEDEMKEILYQAALNTKKKLNLKSSN